MTAGRTGVLVHGVEVVADAFCLAALPAREPGARCLIALWRVREDRWCSAVPAPGGSILEQCRVVADERDR
jgi:hypothetical protein